MGLFGKMNDSRPAELSISRTYNSHRKGKIMVIRGEGEGNIVTVDSLNPVRVGRSEVTNDLIISAKCISRNHCLIEYNDINGSFVVTNLSTNGVFVNEYRLPKNVGVVLKPGTVISLSDNEHLLKLV